jgi:PAS domain-containing protein
MLEQLSDQIRECDEWAAEAPAKADAATEPGSKVEYVAAETHSNEHSKERAEFDEHVIVPAPEGFLPGGAEQILRSLVENSDDAIITKNLNGIISSWNKSAERMVVGQPI